MILLLWIFSIKQILNSDPRESSTLSPNSPGYSEQKIKTLLFWTWDFLKIQGKSEMGNLPEIDLESYSALLSVWKKIKSD